MKKGKTPARTHNSDVLAGFFSVKNKDAYEKTEKNMMLAARLETAMKNRGYSKMEFALAMKVQPSVITRWLSGVHNFTTDTLYDIEKALAICLVNVNEPVPMTIQVLSVTINLTSEAVTAPPCFYPTLQSTLSLLTEKHTAIHN